MGSGYIGGVVQPIISTRGSLFDLIVPHPPCIVSDFFTLLLCCTGENLPTY